MAVIETIAPIFLIIIFGVVLERRGFLKSPFIEEANRFVYLFPLPLLIFTGIMKSNIQDVTASHIAAAIVPTLMILGIAFGIGLAIGLRNGKLGSFVQISFHGNVSYVGLALLLYMLGEDGLRRGSILVGILIFLNNVLAITVLAWTSKRHGSVGKALLSIVTSPVIMATFLGLTMLYLAVPIPGVAMKTMLIMANIALPLALTLMGASMSMGTIWQNLKFSALSAALKLVLLPGIALAFSSIADVPPRAALPAIILLATPTAISTYVLAREMGGDENLASGSVTLSTLLSPFVFVLWIWAVQ